MTELWADLLPILAVMFISPARTLAVILLLPKRSQAILDSLFAWLKKHLRMLAIVIFVGFGLFFLVKGLMGLVG